MNDPLLDDLFKDLDLGQLSENKPNKVKKNLNNLQDGITSITSTKLRSPVETSYEGYTLRPVTPALGEKKTWRRVQRTPMPFDSNKLYDIAIKHRANPDKLPEVVYRVLSSDKQDLIQRILAEKKRDEIHPNAVWEMFDVRRTMQEVKLSKLKSTRDTVTMEVILRRSDATKGATIGRPSGTTAKVTAATSDTIIDLDIPMREKAIKKGVKKTGGQRLRDDDIVQIMDERQQQNDRQFQIGEERDGYVWNGQFWEEKQHNQHHHHAQQQHAQQQQQQQQQWQQWQQQQQQQQHEQLQQHQALHQQQQNEIIRQQQELAHQQQLNQHLNHQLEQQQILHEQQQQQHAWHRGSGGMTHEPNPFTPRHGHIEQFADFPPTVRGDRYASRSRSRSPYHRRRRDGYARPGSLSSSDAGYPSDFSPPSTPPHEERRGKKYYIDGNRRYTIDDRYDARPRDKFVSTRPRSGRRHTIVTQNDYPGAQPRITDFAEGYDQYDFRKTRDSADMLREDARRYDDRGQRQRGYSFTAR